MSSDRYHGMVGRLRHAVLRGSGDTDPSVRAAIEARAAGAAAGAGAGEPQGEPQDETTTGAGAAGGLQGVPESARAFVDKVIRHAYRVTDRDVEALRAAGLSEDAIFELTISAAVGAGRGRLERGLAALRGEEA